MGLGSKAMSIMLLRQCKKDKQFCKWLYRNRTIIRYGGYYVSAILLAYKKGGTLERAQKYEALKKIDIQKEIIK